MPDPYKKQIYDKIWSLLEARTQLTSLLLPGNRLKQTGDGWLREFYHRAPNDFPQIQLTNGRFTHSGFTKPEMTYGMEKDAFPGLTGEWLVQRRLEFKLTITGRDLVNTVLDQLEEESQTALLLGGAYWGLDSFLSQWGPLIANQREADVQGEKRLQSIINIPVDLEFSGRALVAAAQA